MNEPLYVGAQCWTVVCVCACIFENVLGRKNEEGCVHLELLDCHIGMSIVCV